MIIKKKVVYILISYISLFSDWLKISMYLEITQPFNDPSRLKKVYNRLNLFESEFKYDLCKTPKALNFKDKNNFYDKNS